jgi:hypothetical protein
VVVGVTGDTGVTGVDGVDAVSSLLPQAASDKAIKDMPPARAIFAFFFSHADTSFVTRASCFFEESISL